MVWLLILLGLVAAVIVAVLVARLMSPKEEAAPPTPGVVDARGPRPTVADFHVRGEEARVYFEVPLPEASVDDVLHDLLLREAVEVVREKRHELPIAQVRRVVAYGQRNGEPVEVGRLDLETPGELPVPTAVELHPHASRLDFDPIGEFTSLTSVQAPAVAETVKREELGPVGAEIRLTGAVEAGLRAQAVDPDSVSAGELVLGLLRLSGYLVSPAEGPDAHLAAKGGVRTFIRIVGHEPGSYPELSESDISEFMFDFASSGTDRGLLVSDKYCPFQVYERERREPRVRFISRERLQAFVDTLAVS